MRRVKFQKGEQRRFLKRVILESGSPSLRALNQFGFDVPYSTWKNYFGEKRNLPEDLFKDLCLLIKIDFSKLEIEFLDEHYGQVIGGKTIRNK